MKRDVSPRGSGCTGADAIGPRGRALVQGPTAAAALLLTEARPSNGGAAARRAPARGREC